MGKTVMIAHARANEEGRATGGKPGDQTGKELRTQAWYGTGNPWYKVFRPKSEGLRDLIAANALKLVNNEHVGYGQDNRTSAYLCAANVNYQLDKIDVDCQCDCSSMVALVLIASGVEVPPTMYTGNEVANIEKTGLFYSLTDSKYLTSQDYLMTGDILLKLGHTAIVVSDGECAKTNYFPQYYGSSTSIVDILYSHGEKATFAYRRKIAKANGIANYMGTAKQNTQLVELIKAGKLIRPEG